MLQCVGVLPLRSAFLFRGRFACHARDRSALRTCRRPGGRFLCTVDRKAGADHARRQAVLSAWRSATPAARWAFRSGPIRRWPTACRNEWARRRSFTSCGPCCGNRTSARNSRSEDSARRGGRPQGRLRPADVPARVAVRSGRDVRRADERSSRSESPTSRCGNWCSTFSSNTASSCSCWPAATKNHHAFVGGYPGARAQRDAHLLPPGRQSTPSCTPSSSRRSTRTWSSPGPCCTTSASSAS